MLTDYGPLLYVLACLSSRVLVEYLLWDLDPSFKSLPHCLGRNPGHITHPPGQGPQVEVVSIKQDAGY